MAKSLEQVSSLVRANANFSVNGNPDFVGAMVVKSFSGNGNNTMHFDKELLTAANPLDYRIASYVEDIR